MSISILEWDSLEASRQERLLRRSETDIEASMDQVRPIMEAVRTRGDEAIREYTALLDKADLSGLPLQASQEEFDQAENSLPQDVREALDYAIDNVRHFHRDQVSRVLALHELRPGLFSGERARPIPSVGLYVPRGRGSFPSMLYMLAVPAVLAGVKRIAIVTPPDPDGSINPGCLYAAKRCGVSTVYRFGGSQAIAALVWGTATVQPVAKIVGPGNMYVTAAKRLVSHLVDIGLPAGPSESIILADKAADPQKVAWDLLIEAEHGEDSSAILVSDSRPLLQSVADLLPKLIADTGQPRRGFLEAVFGPSGYGGLLQVPSLEAGIALVNRFAPEHLQLQVADPLALLDAIENAGEILLGDTTPFSLANYVTGANAVLPTGGNARLYSAVSVRDFVKYSSVVRASNQALVEAGRHAAVLARYEGFESHAAALERRLG